MESEEIIIGFDVGVYESCCTTFRKFAHKNQSEVLDEIMRDGLEKSFSKIQKITVEPKTMILHKNFQG
jgi:hypothetical protein